MAEWVQVAVVDDLAEGKARVVTAKGKRLALSQVEGQFYAIEDLCTHDGGPLGEGELFGDQIECPRHGARFNVKTGEAVILPAVVPVKTFPVKVDNGKILVEV